MLTECVSEGSESEVEHKARCILDLAYKEAKVLGLDKKVVTCTIRRVVEARRKRRCEEQEQRRQEEQEQRWQEEQGKKVRFGEEEQAEEEDVHCHLSCLTAASWCFVSSVSGCVGVSVMRHACSVIPGAYSSIFI